VWGNDSLILTIWSSILNRLPGIVDWVLINDLVGVDLSVGLLLIIRLRVRGLRIGLDLNGALVWWSAISSCGRVVTISLLNNGVISMSENRAERENFLVLTIELNSRLVWWSTISLSGGVVSIGLLDTRVSSVVLDRLKAPNWLLSSDEAKKASNSK